MYTAPTLADPLDLCPSPSLMHFEGSFTDHSRFGTFTRRSSRERYPVMALVARFVTCATWIGLLVLAVPTTASDCLPLQELNYIAASEIARHSLDRTAYYFCDPSAPEQFRCTCPTASACASRLSADGRELGECVCCSSWVFGVVGGLSILLILAIAFCTYACWCRGKWWCDGYHPPIAPFMPRRSPPVVIPASRPLASNIFRGFRSGDFDTGYVAPAEGSPEAAVAAAAAAGAETQRRLRSQARRQRGAAAAAAAGTADPEEAEALVRDRAPMDDVVQPTPSRSGGVSVRVDRGGDEDDDDAVEMENVGPSSPTANEGTAAQASGSGSATQASDSGGGHTARRRRAS
jgi:hypothetical protein